MMSSRERFIKACHCEKTDRPPVWLMRQAGRFLPEYRALRERHDFMTLLTDKDLITEVSLQPWRRFQMDAVIVFADILLLPHVMGMDLKFIEGQGPKFSKLISTEEDVKNLKPFQADRDILFLTKALQQIKKELKDQAALIGFAGAPWTVASYMMEPEPLQNETVLKKLLERLTEETISYLKAKIKAGVDCIQIFDSWGGSLSPADYAIWSAPYIKEIVMALRLTQIPIILYIKESEPLLDQMLEIAPSVISVGWETPLEKVREYISLRQACPEQSRRGSGRTVNTVAIQGNFNPHILMQATPEEIRAQTQAMLKTMEDYPGYIANLGHGILPKTPVENVGAFIETVKSSREKR